MHLADTLNNGLPQQLLPYTDFFFFPVGLSQRWLAVWLAVTAVSTHERHCQGCREGVHRRGLTEEELKRPPREVALGRVTFADEVRLEEKGQ